MEVWNELWMYACEAAAFVGDHMLILNFILSIIIIFFQRKEPKSAWAWLLVLNAIPGVGFLLYLLAGTDMHKRKMFKIKGIEEQVNEAVRRQEYSVRSRELEQKAPEMKEFSDLVFFNLQSAGSVLSGDNDVQIFTDGNDKFDALIEDIRNAQSYIFLQYYIIKNDLLFNRIRDVLVEKVSEGVEVRILYDAMGCRSVRKSYWKEAEAAGIKTAVFFPALFGQLNLRVNYRNHRKIAVIDGRIGYVGGFNIGKEYIGLDPKFGHWRDTHLRICGSAVGGLLMRYIQDWDYAARENLFADPKYFVTVSYTHLLREDVEPPGADAYGAAGALHRLCRRLYGGSAAVRAERTHVPGYFKKGQPAPAAGKVLCPRGAGGKTASFIPPYHGTDAVR